jgi:hypothetical protein
MYCSQLVQVRQTRAPIDVFGLTGHGGNPSVYGLTELPDHHQRIDVA